MRGRPKGPAETRRGDDSRRITVRLNQKESAQLDKLCKKSGKSAAGILRQLLASETP